MNECEHVILLDVCCTIKRPTTMCLAKTNLKKIKNKTTTKTTATAYLPHFVVDLRLRLLQDVLVGGQHKEGEGHDRGGGVVSCQQEHQGVGLDLVLRQTCGQ